MGLSISRSIIESHRGHLWAESGSAPMALIFQFTIPLRSPEIPMPETQPGHFRCGRRRFCERRRSAIFWNRSGLHVRDVRLRRRVLECARAGGAKLSRSSISELPGRNGLEVQQEMLQAIGIQIPIVFITAHGDVPMTSRAMKAGAVDFLAKPFQKKDLLDAVTSSA